MPSDLSVDVRAYDLGGFGDIAGAMRVASHLQGGGIQVNIRPVTDSAAKKLDVLKSDVPVVDKRSKNAIQIDVAGHYRDGRNLSNNDVPHNYTEDMDNWQDRKGCVPLYIKSGIEAKGRQLQAAFGGYAQNPMFYRPLREWELPMPHERDVKALIVNAIEPKLVHKELLPKGWDIFFSKKSQIALERELESIERIGFAHFGFAYEKIDDCVAHFFNHPYIIAANEAAAESGKGMALGVFLGKDLETRIARDAVGLGFSVFTRDDFHKNNDNTPTLIFLGPQPQMTTTSLFISSTMPNLVTGDLSLSDALYALLAMDGQAFYYDCPGWKAPTFHNLRGILNRVPLDTRNEYFAHKTNLGNIFLLGSMNVEQDVNDEEYMNHLALDQGMVIQSLQDKDAGDFLKTYYRKALFYEIAQRFGDIRFASGGNPEGLYYPRGTPFLIQDATENVVRSLANDADLLKYAEKMRMMLSGETAPHIIVEAQVLPLPQNSVAGAAMPGNNPDIYGTLESLVGKSFKGAGSELESAFSGQLSYAMHFDAPKLSVYALPNIVGMKSHKKSEKKEVSISHGLFLGYKDHIPPYMPSPSKIPGSSYSIDYQPGLENFIGIHYTQKSI